MLSLGIDFGEPTRWDILIFQSLTPAWRPELPSLLRHQSPVQELSFFFYLWKSSIGKAALLFRFQLSLGLALCYSSLLSISLIPLIWFKIFYLLYRLLSVGTGLVSPSEWLSMLSRNSQIRLLEVSCCL